MVEHVHKQDGLIVKAPPFKDQKLNAKVKVQMQLCRNTDGIEFTSESKDFYYIPNRRKSERIEKDGPCSYQGSAGVASSITMFDKMKLIVFLYKNGYDDDEIYKAINDLLAEKEEMAFLDWILLATIDDVQDLIMLLSKFKLTSVLYELNELNQNCLHLSILSGHDNLLPVLAELGAIIDQHDACGDSPLHVSAIEDSEIFTKQLLATFPNIKLNELNDDGFTPLHLAVKNNQFEIVKLLIKAGADVQIKSTPSGDNALQIALDSKQQNKDLIHFLIDSDIMKSSENTTLLPNGGFDAQCDKISTDFLDHGCLQELCRILDKNRKWEDLANIMDLEAKIDEFRKSISPSISLFKHLEVSLLRLCLFIY